MTPSNVSINLATHADLPRILELTNWAARETSANFALEPELLAPLEAAWRDTHDRHPWLVATVDRHVVGFARSRPHHTRGAYAWTAEMTVYIDPEFHGRKIGTTLYNVLIPILRSQGYETLLAGIVKGHEASERLHANVGFVRCATFHRVGWKFNAWHDVGYWELHFHGEGRAPTALRPVKDVLRDGAFL